MEKSEILENLINHYADGNKAKFGRLIGESPQTISAWLRRNTFNVSSIYKVFTDVNPHWLLTGEGEMLKSGLSEISNNVNTGDFSPVNVNGNMEVRQTSMPDKRELELLRATIADKERTIQIQQQLINELQKRK